MILLWTWWKSFERHFTKLFFFSLLLFYLSFLFFLLFFCLLLFYLSFLFFFCFLFFLFFFFSYFVFFFSSSLLSFFSFWLFSSVFFSFIFLFFFSFWVALLPRIHSHFLLAALLPQMILDQIQALLSLPGVIHFDCILLIQSLSHLTNVLQVLLKARLF